MTLSVFKRTTFGTDTPSSFQECFDFSSEDISEVSGVKRFASHDDFV